MYHFQKQYSSSTCLIGKLVSFGLLRKKKKKLRQFQKMLPHICLAFFPCYHSADPMCSFQQTSPSDEASKKQLLMPHRPSVDHSDEPFQRQRAVSAVSIITSALEGKMCLQFPSWKPSQHWLTGSSMKNTNVFLLHSFCFQDSITELLWPL